MTKRIAYSALILSLLFETLVYGAQAGLGYLLFWFFALIATVSLLKSAERLRLERMWMFLPSLLLAYAVFRYDAKVTQTWGAWLCLGSLAWAVAWNLLAEWKPDVLSRLFPSGTWNPAKVASNARDGLRVECRWDKEVLLQVLRGSFFAGFLLLVFGSLLSSADDLFGAKVAEFSHSLNYFSLAPVARILLWLGLIAGGLRLWMTAPPCEARITRSTLAPTELFIALGSLNILFFSFIAIQMRYLFGDASLIEALGFNHASYARSGFFELSVCIILILPLVFMAYRAAEVNKEPKLRYLGGSLIVSASGLAASALKRMLLYIEVYGLSVDRFYAAAGILIAMSVLAWAAFACFKPRPVSWLLARQNVTVILLVSFLGLMDVDAIVARSHLKLVEAGTRSMDSYYLANELSADAIPVYQEFEKRLTGEKLETLLLVKSSLQRSPLDTKGPSFNYSRWLAHREEI